MDLAELTGQQSKWMEGSGPFADVVISSRVRLARNLTGIPFPPYMDVKQQQIVINQVKQATEQDDFRRIAGPLLLLGLHEFSSWQRQILVERHLISPQHAEEGGRKALVLNAEQSVSIMVNEEDHLRIQCLLPALQLQECWQTVNLFDDALEQHLDLAFSEEYGYLTSCPTNVGTGLRASIMLHLPGLVLVKRARRVMTALSQVGLAVRGMYGEGTEASGNLFQISNQITLGQSEEEIVGNVFAVTKQIVEQERTAREALLSEAKPQIEDRVFRAFGALSQARIINSQEALSLLSDLRLGIDLKLIKGLDPRLLNELMVLIQPASLQNIIGRELDGLGRDQARSRLIRQKVHA